MCGEPFFLAQAVGRRMIEHSQTNSGFRGRIVNIASVAALRTMPRLGIYSMTKAAVIQMTRAQAAEWGRFGINVNAICPGYVRTEMNETLWETENGQRLIQSLPPPACRRRRGPGRSDPAAVLGRKPDDQRGRDRD